MTSGQVAAGLLSERRVRLDPSQPGVTAPRQILSQAVIFDERNPEKPIRLLTSLSDVLAEVVGQVYRGRWQSEVFFRWLGVHAPPLTAPTWRIRRCRRRATRPTGNPTATTPTAGKTPTPEPPKILHKVNDVGCYWVFNGNIVERPETGERSYVGRREGGHRG